MDLDTLPQSLYLQYMPDNEALDCLARLQQDMAQASPVGRLVPPLTMHLTILHFGHTVETFRQITAINPQLTSAQYTAAVEDLIGTARTVLPDSITVQPDTLELFGAKANVLALSCKADAEVIALFRLTKQAARTFLVQCGLKHDTILPHRPRALQIADAFTPHISLIKGYTGTPPTASPHPLPDTMRLSRFPIRELD